MRPSRFVIVPPRRVRLRRPQNSRQLWPVLAVENRAQILNALGRVVAKNLMPPPVRQEVTHEQP